MTTAVSPDEGVAERIEDQSWVVHAACQGRTSLFFPPYAERPQARRRREERAKAICSTCPVRTRCLWWGRSHHEYGIWGGENEEERVAAGYSLMAPIGTRHVRSPGPVAMPLAELTDPDDDELDEIEEWLG